MAKKKYNVSYIIMIIVCLLFLIFGTFFVRFMVKQNLEQNISYLHDIASQEKALINQQIMGDWETLTGISICFEKMELTDTDILIPYIKEINDKNDFIRMGFIGEDGKTVLVDINGNTYTDLDFSQYEFFQNALAGENSISDTFKDPFSDDFINYYGVPVVNDNEIIGVLCAVNTTDVLRNITDASMFEDGGYSNIIKSNGEFVVRSLHKFSDPKSSKVNDMGQFTSEAQITIQNDLNAQKEGELEYTYKNEKICAVYLPIEINNWFIISVVPKSVLNQGLDSIIGVILIIASAFIIFSVLVYRISKMSRKNKERLENLAYIDPVTNYSSYAKFLLDSQNFITQKPKENYAFWYCDVKKFKYFNDLFGYGAGDQVLKYLADLIHDTLQKDELFCRANADNFIGLKFYDEADDIIQWFDFLNLKMYAYETTDVQSYPLELSIGIYCSSQEQEDASINDMINRANMAQKSIKQSPSECYAFYSGQIREQILFETEMEAQMYQALQDHEFQIYIQPKVDIQNNNKIAGGEVLVRWNNHQKGFMLPGMFIPLFEKNGFITQLDRFMFEGLCKWFRNYLDMGNEALRISINVSRLGLYQEDFLSFYINTKDKYKIPDNLLELEFTESVALDNDELFKNLVIQLQENGFICSLDDFGSGYSSLNILKDLPMQVLKLDMLFFRSGESTKRERIVVGNIIAMSKQLHMQTVSEGVEKKEQVEFLKTMGCDLIQGYIFAKPMPLSEFEILLKDKKNGYIL